MLLCRWHVMACRWQSDSNVPWALQVLAAKGLIVAADGRGRPDPRVPVSIWRFAGATRPAAARYARGGGPHLAHRVERLNVSAAGLLSGQRLNFPAALLGPTLPP